MGCHVVDHPLVRARLTTLRDAATPTREFRSALHDLTFLLGYEVLRDLPEDTFDVTTPLETCRGSRVSRPVVIMPILRAGLGMAKALTDLLPDASIGHIGMFRDEATLQPQTYFLSMPPAIEDAIVICVDPMLATGNSASAALMQLKESGAKNIRLVCIVGSPQGVELIEDDHPDVPVFIAALDRELNDRGYILPGLGDAGDRYFGT